MIGRLEGALRVVKYKQAYQSLDPDRMHTRRGDSSSALVYYASVSTVTEQQSTAPAVYLRLARTR
jgi:hypothetical protein